MRTGPAGRCRQASLQPCSSSSREKTSLSRFEGTDTPAEAAIRMRQLPQLPFPAHRAGILIFFFLMYCRRFSPAGQTSCIPFPLPAAFLFLPLFSGACFAGSLPKQLRGIPQLSAVRDPSARFFNPSYSISQKRRPRRSAPDNVRPDHCRRPRSGLSCRR